MFNKLTTFNMSRTDIEVFDSELVKTASEIILPEGHMYDPDFLYMKVRAVSAGENWGPNKNADFFPEAELIKHYKTFLEAHAFKNHENKQVENAIGDVIDAIWNDKMKYVELLIRIDRKIAPSIVRGFEKGFMTDVSMGCKIQHSICSICGNKARVASEYCGHIKYEKHKVYDDGRRTYEINIGPKFHDISAVLNGADRTAKMTGLLIMGSKVAFSVPQSIEKVANMNEAFADLEAPFHKTAGMHDENVVGDIFERRSERFANTKEGFMQKIAEIKKEIKGKIVSIARGQHAQETFKDMDKIVDIFKMFYTEFLSQDQCKQIADAINDLARKNSIPAEQVFEKFVNILEVAGIELSSLEFDRIMSHLVGYECDEPKICDAVNEFDYSKAHELKAVHDSIIDKQLDNPMNVPSMYNMFNAVTGLLKNNVQVAPRNLGAISVKIIKRPSIPVPGIEGALMNLIKPLIPGRSFHREHLVPRIIKVVKSDSAPLIENLAHFALPYMVKTAGEKSGTINAMSTLGYAIYQANRVKLANSQAYADGIMKFASDIGVRDSLDQHMEKTAFAGKGYTTRKAFIYGLPLTFAYSAAQRARMNNGENIAAFNRYIAENPANAFAVQLLLAPQISRGIGKATGKTVGAVKNAIDILRKTAEDNLFVLTKSASECINVDNDFTDTDMFKDAAIDAKMLEKYSQSQLKAIKTATILYSEGREDICDNVLHKEALSKNDIGQYLQISTDCFKIEIEKQASFVKELLTSAAQDVIFNPPGTSLITTIPGNLIDGAVFAHLSSKAKKQQEAAEMESRTDSKIIK